MRSWSAVSRATPAQAWQLIAQPARWHEWAPHVRGAWGLGSPEVSDGARGFVRLIGFVPVPVRIVDKQAGRSWTWQVGPARLEHRVEPRSASGCIVAVDLMAPGPLEAALSTTYGPVIGVMVRRLARVAARAP